MAPRDLRIIFLGTPEFAVASLDALERAGYNIVGVVTAPDKPAGRGMKLQESAVKKYAAEKGLTILQPEKLKNPAFLEQLKSLKADLQVVVAFRMLPEVVWNMPSMGTINVHGSSTYFQLIVIPCGNYTHKSKYVLPVRPSPNLPEIQSIYWYPSTCFFEATPISEGRGTEKPFQIFGHPSLPKTMYAFVPEPRDYAKEYKPYGKTCYGWNLSDAPEEVLKKVDNKIQLKYLLEAYRLFPKKDSFFILPKSGKEEEVFFNRLAGNASLMQQIKKGVSEKEIRKSWQPRLNAFKKIRKKYLMYPDFE